MNMDMHAFRHDPHKNIKPKVQSNIFKKNGYARTQFRHVQMEPAQNMLRTNQHDNSTDTTYNKFQHWTELKINKQGSIQQQRYLKQ